MTTIAHTTNERRRDRFGIVASLKTSNIEVEVLLVNASENSKAITQGSASPFTRIAMNFSSAIAIIIPSPFVSRMADSMVIRMSTVIRAPLVTTKERAFGGDSGINQSMAGSSIRMMTDKVAMLTGVTRDDIDYRWSIGSIGATAPSLVGSSPRRIIGV